VSYLIGKILINLGTHAATFAIDGGLQPGYCAVPSNQLLVSLSKQASKQARMCEFQ
jgi:hypothetical protein